MRLSHLAEYAGLRLLMSMTRRLSPVQATRVGDILGDLVFHVTGIRKKLVMEHLVRIYGETGDDDKRQAMARSVYRQMGRTAVEHARLLAGRTPDLRDRLEISGEEHVARARLGGRGVILVTGHFGYWEMLGATVAFLGYPITVVAKKLHNPAVDRLVHEGRERLGMAVTPMDSAPPAIFRALRRNECVGLLADQDAGARRRVRRVSGIRGVHPPGTGTLRAAHGRPHRAMFHHSIRPGTPPGLFRNPDRSDSDR